MPDALDSTLLCHELRSRIDYLRDLGIFDLYRREGASILEASLAADILRPGELSLPGPPAIRPVASAGAVSQPAPVSEGFSAGAEDDSGSDEDLDIAPRKVPPQPIAFTPGPLIAPAARAQVLEALREEIGDCTRCPLGFAGRHSIVFGDGDPNARLLFVGEGPGADEDMQGIPFIGRAGQLLNNMITAMGLKRDQVYIANIVKCRPPKNRVPEPVEAVTCSQFLLRQIDIVRPEVIVALGSTAATYLLGGKSPLSVLRGRIHAAHGAKLIVTYHPAYLLRDPSQKKAAWTDLQLAMAELRR